MPTRAKFVLQEEKRNAYQPGTRYLKFAAQYDPDCPEDQRFSKYTPSGTLEMTVDNPNAQFELGTAYYLDFTPAVTEAAEAAPADPQQ